MFYKIEKTKLKFVLLQLLNMKKGGFLSDTKYKVKYPQAALCLEKDRNELLTFYDFPAEHWKHTRTTNPIESTFATVRHRTKRSKGCLARETAFVMVFKLIKNAEKTWRRRAI